MLNRTACAILALTAATSLNSFPGASSAGPGDEAPRVPHARLAETGLDELPSAVATRARKAVPAPDPRRALQARREPQTRPPLQPLAPGAATIWYLGHCGYAVKTARHLLVFDYIELEEHPTERGLAKGFIDPAEIAEERVRVFVSHDHVDHNDPVIRGWEARIPGIRYFYGWNAGIGGAHQDLPAPRASAVVDGLEIDTVNSHHSGVPEAAWLVKVDGLVLFHAGDYQGKMGRGAPSNAVADMKHLMTRTGRVDIAFVGAVVEDWNLAIMNGLAPAVLFPMHYRKAEERYRGFASDVAAAGVKIPVVCPTRRGDRFEFQDGRVRVAAGGAR